MTPFKYLSSLPRSLTVFVLAILILAGLASSGLFSAAAQESEAARERQQARAQNETNPSTETKPQAEPGQQLAPEGGPVADETFFYAYNFTGDRLVGFLSNRPGILNPDLPLTGLASDEDVLGIDFRPANQALYGIATNFTNDRVVTINTSTGAVTSVGGTVATPTGGVFFGVDFNPAADRIRQLDDADNSRRLNPNDGTLTGTDTNLAYVAGDVNFGQNPSVVHTAYTNSSSPAPLTTTLFGIDSNTDSLVRIGGLDGVPSPNTGQLTTIGPLGVNATSFGGFDIVPGTNQGYAVLRVAGVSVLHRIDLVTGAATAIGPIGAGTTIDGIAAFDVNAPGTTVSYTGLAVPIPDNNPTGVNIPLTVSGVGTIRDLNVRFDNGGACDATVGLTNAAINHTFVGDLRIRLTSPSGVTRTIFNRRGGTRENICRTDVNDNFVFSPFSVLTSVTGQPVAHNFSPEQPLTAFRGQNADGTWTLNVSDNAGLDTGSLRRFSLIFNALDAALEKTPHDFDGDGRTDIAISRNNAGVREWWVQRSSNNTVFAAAFGAGGDQITPADYTGDGLADIAQWRPATGEWFVLRSENSTFYAVPFGNQSFGDIPAPGDFDGDGKADVTVYRPGAGTWFVLQSSNNLTLFIPFGNANDLPVTGDYDGDGKADAAVYRTNGANKEWWIRRSSNGTNFATQFGVTGDRAVPGDYTGDGKTDVALWRPSTGQWFILRSEDFSFYAFPFGTTGDVPAPGDFDGDGRFDAGIFRPTGATWFIQRSSDNGTTIQGFGLSTDQPIPNAYVR